MNTAVAAPNVDAERRTPMPTGGGGGGDDEDRLGWRAAFSDSDDGASDEDDCDEDVVVTGDDDGLRTMMMLDGVSAPPPTMSVTEDDARRFVEAETISTGVSVAGATDRGGGTAVVSNANVGGIQTAHASVNVGRIGPELRELRSAQGEHAEYYTISHYDRLYGSEAPWRRESRGSKVWCKDVHGPGCTECTSCHFCRQKTTDRKTTCQCGFWKRAPEGGRGRGVWCGWCLEMRMGENLDEAVSDAEWRCPVCRDICNCSGANCLRAKRNLFPTQQLTNEALTYGWQSVAHYLITTAIVSGRDAPPMLDLPAAYAERQRRRRNPNAGGGADGAGGGRGTIPGMFGARSGKEAKAMALRAKVAESVRAAFGELNDGRDEGANDADADEGLDDEHDTPTRGGAREGSAQGVRSRRSRASRGRARGRTENRDAYDSSDGSELDSSDSESDLETETDVAPVRHSVQSHVAHTAAETGVAPHAVIDEPINVEVIDAAPFRARAHTISGPRPYGARDNDGGTVARQTKHKRARTTYGGNPPVDGWRSDVDDGGDDIIEPIVIERSVAQVANEDEIVVPRQISRQEPLDPAAVVTTMVSEYGETLVVREGDVARAPTVRRRRRRRRRLPRPGDEGVFATVNPEVIAASQSRATHASAREEEEESKAAEGEGACAEILRSVRCGDIIDESRYREALVDSNQALKTSTVESDAGITVDEAELRAFCALVVRIARVSPKTEAGLSVISDAREVLADAETFRMHRGTARAIILRALLRCADHAAFRNVQVRAALIEVLTLMAELGQEYCLIRETMRAKPGESASTPLPEHIQASIAELRAERADDNAGDEIEVSLNDDDVALLLLERLEAAHVLLFASMAALRRFVRGPPLAGREELFCPTLAAFLSPEFPFKIKLRKQALRLVATAVTAAARDWGDPKSPEIVALAKNCSEHIWPAMSSLLASDFPARSANAPQVVLGGSGVTRGVIEGTARVMALLLRSGVWVWGNVEAAIVAPHTPGTFWRLAGAPYRALAMRLYARLLDATPVLYAGVGTPLLKLWALSTMDPSAGESGASGVSRARARFSRAAKRHPVLFAAFPSSTLLEGCERSENASLEVRGRWFAEVLHQAATTTVSPKARLAAIAAANAFWDVLSTREAEVRGKHNEGQFAAASALVLTIAVSHLSEAFNAPPPKLIPMLVKTIQLSATRGGRNSALRADILSHALLTIAANFNGKDTATLNTLVAVLHETIERPHAADGEQTVSAMWSALDASSGALYQSLGVPAEKVTALRDFVLKFCAKRAIERARYTASSKSASQGAIGWAKALSLLAKTSSNHDWFRELMHPFLDALQSPAVPIGKGAAPPPISISDASLRAALYATLTAIVSRHPAVVASVTGNESDPASNAENVFFVAIARAALGEITYALGSAEMSKGYLPLTENDRNVAGRKLRASIPASAPNTTLEEVYRSFKPPIEVVVKNVSSDPGANSAGAAVTLTTVAVAALRFITALGTSHASGRRMVQTYVLSPIKAAMNRRDSHARQTLKPHVHALWTSLGLLKDTKENEPPANVTSVPPSPAVNPLTRIEIPPTPWPAGTEAPCAFASIVTKPKGTVVNVVGQLDTRKPSRGVDVKENPKTGKKFDMLILYLNDHAGDKIRIQLIGKSAQACAAALDVEGIPRDIAVGFVGLTSQAGKDGVAMCWDPKERAEMFLNPDNF